MGGRRPYGTYWCLNCDRCTLHCKRTRACLDDGPCSKSGFRWLTVLLEYRRCAGAVLR